MIDYLINNMAEVNNSEDNYIYFECIKVKGKVRVRVISQGYNNQANVQFPRAIRIEGKIFRAPSSALSFASGPRGTFFYRVTKSMIEAVDGGVSSITIDNIYGEVGDDCVICLEEKCEMVFIPCGHFCTCESCCSSLQSSSFNCPLCRANIIQAVNRDQL